jgi:tRNA1(Val) A37 N6-methylase TrmN6
MVLWKIMSLHNNNNNNDNTTGTPKNPEPSLPFHIVYGFEAREEAVGLLQRSLDFNIGIQTPLRQRVHIVRTDFRSYNNGNGNDDDIESHDDTMNDVDFTIHQNQNNNHLLLLQNQLDVVTGTPPYFQVDFHIPSSSTAKTNSSTKHTNCHNQHSNTNQPNSDTIATKVPVLTTSNNNKTATTDTNIIATIRQGGMPLSIQSAPARCEFRGGIEAYCQTASYLLRPGSGMLCICENYHNHNRAIQSFRTYHFHLIKYYIIEGKVGRGPLFCVYVARKIANPVDVQDTSENVSSTPSVPEVVHLAVRDENGEWTKEYQHMVLDYMSILH